MAGLLRIKCSCSSKRAFSSGYASFRLGKPSWRLSDLGIDNSSNQANSCQILDEASIDYVSALAKIDLKSSSVDKKEVIKDVNTILQCAKALEKVDLSSSSDGSRTFLEPVKYSDLREDKEVKLSADSKKRILSNAHQLVRDYYSVPKVKD